TNAQASQARYVATTTANQGTATFSVQLPITDTYVVWCRVLGIDTAHDSFFVSVDGGPEDVYDVAENTWTNAWQWTRVNGRGGTTTPLTINPRTFNLSAGSHTIAFRAREISTGLDKIIVSNDAGFVARDTPDSPL